MITVNKNEMIFDTLWEFLNFVESPVTTHKLGRASIEQPSSSWNGYATVAQAAQMGREGWEEGVKLADEFSVELSNAVSGKMLEPEVHWDVTGDWLDVGRYVTGEPEVFGEMIETEYERTAYPPKVIHIVVNVCASSGVSEDVIKRRGAAVAALVKALELKGRRCKIDVVAPNNGGRSGRTFYLTIAAKPAEEPMQLNKLVFLMAHPSMLRRLIFSAWEHADEETVREFGFSNRGMYGMVGEMPADQRGDIYLGVADLRRSNWDKAYAEQWIVDTLKEQGIGMKDEEAA